MNSAPDPTRDALYAAILAHPDEDTPRLVYADHIEEMGDSARAEFIRLQCKLAALNEWDDGYTAADVRCRRLLAEHPQWYDQFPPSERAPRESAFARGFIEHTVQPVEQFLDGYQQLFAAVPLRSAAFYHTTADECRRLARCAALVRLRRLYIGTTREAIAELPQVPGLVGLERLDVRVSELPAEQLRRLVTAPHLRGLRALVLRVCGVTGHESESNVDRWEWPPGLRELAFEDAPAPDELFPRLIAGAPWLSRLERLSFHGRSDRGGGTYEAVRAGRLAGLVEFSAQRSVVGPATVGRLRNVTTAGLRSLRLPQLKQGSLGPGTDPTLGLFESAWVSELRRLDLQYANLNNPWLPALADAPCGRTLRALDLGGTRFTANAIRSAFGPKRAWPALQKLDLSATNCPEELLADLVDHPGLQALVSLQAGNWQPAPKFVQRLAEAPAAARFRELNLRIPLDDPTADALARSPHLADLDLLFVDEGQAGRRSLARLRARFGARLVLDTIPF